KKGGGCPALERPTCYLKLWLRPGLRGAHALLLAVDPAACRAAAGTAAARKAEAAGLTLGNRQFLDACFETVGRRGKVLQQPVGHREEKRGPLLLGEGIRGRSLEVQTRLLE